MPLSTLHPTTAQPSRKSPLATQCPPLRVRRAGHSPSSSVSSTSNNNASSSSSLPSYTYSGWYPHRCRGQERIVVLPPASKLAPPSNAGVIIAAAAAAAMRTRASGKAKAKTETVAEIKRKRESASSSSSDLLPEPPSPRISWLSYEAAIRAHMMLPSPFPSPSSSLASPPLQSDVDAESDEGHAVVTGMMGPTRDAHRRVQVIMT